MIAIQLDHVSNSAYAITVTVVGELECETYISMIHQIKVIAEIGSQIQCVYGVVVVVVAQNVDTFVRVDHAAVPENSVS